MTDAVLRPMTRAELETFKGICGKNPGNDCEPVDVYWFQCEVIHGVQMPCDECPVETCPTCGQNVPEGKLLHCDVCGDTRWRVLIQCEDGVDPLGGPRKNLARRLANGEKPWPER